MSSMNVRLCVSLRGVREWLDSGGPAEWRPEIERQLYLAISGGRYQTALPNALSDVSAELLRSGEKFPERLRVDDSTARKLFAEGLGVLSDHELARLSWSQGELAVLQNLFGDADGYSDDWFLVWETATEEERQQCDRERVRNDELDRVRKIPAVAEIQFQIQLARQHLCNDLLAPL